MLSWTSLVSLLLSLALEVVRYLQRKAQYDQEKLRSAILQMEKANALVKAADLAAKSIRNDPADILRDPDNLDNTNTNDKQ